MSKKVKWEKNDIFCINLIDEDCTIGQILSYEPDAMNSVLCAFFSIKYNADSNIDISTIDSGKLISIQFVTRDLLDLGTWRIVGNAALVDYNKYIKIVKLRKRGFIGTKIQGSGNIVQFLNAYFGLLHWDMMHDEEYFDKLLLPGVNRPPNVILS